MKWGQKLKVGLVVGTFEATETPKNLSLEAKGWKILLNKMIKSRSILTNLEVLVLC